MLEKNFGYHGKALYSRSLTFLACISPPRSPNKIYTFNATAAMQLSKSIYEVHLFIMQQEFLIQMMEMLNWLMQNSMIPRPE